MFQSDSAFTQQNFHLFKKRKTICKDYLFFQELRTPQFLQNQNCTGTAKQAAPAQPLTGEAHLTAAAAATPVDHLYHLPAPGA